MEQKISQDFFLEPDVIAAVENIAPNVNNDFILAKNFLKQQSAPTGDSLYDHLVDLINKIVSQKPPDVVDTFEQYSWELKKEKFRPNFDLLRDLYLSPPQLSYVMKLDDMLKLVASKAESFEEFGEEEERELDLEEETWKTSVADLIDHNYYFKEAGYGLADSECYAVYMALKMLGIKEPVATVRYFGKIYGTKAHYYIAETDLTMEELDRRIRIFDMKEMAGEGEGDDEHKSEDEMEGKEELGEGEHALLPTGPVPPRLPPLPESTWKATPPIPTERPGQGTNKKVYWVCHEPGDPWVCLPDVTPDQIRVARLTVRCMTGELDSEVSTYPPFQGTEINYLRAQIARIAAATAISPQGFYTFGSGEEEDVDLDMGEGGGDMQFSLNTFYQGHTLKDLMDRNMNYWVHHGRHILKQGRTLWWNPSADIGDEAIEEEDDEGLPHAEPESGPSLMTPLAEDARVEGLPAWQAKCSSVVVPERALVLMRSNVWPGAVAYATTGKKSECMYTGWGLKFQPPNFSPLQLPPVQAQYLEGPEVMEMQDPSFADEEAYRIAHLPPQPPAELPGEGEGMDLEEEEDD